MIIVIRKEFVNVNRKEIIIKKIFSIKKIIILKKRFKMFVNVI